jgi:hypothetical protein
MLSSRLQTCFQTFSEHSYEAEELIEWSAGSTISHYYPQVDHPRAGCTEGLKPMGMA